MNRIDRVTAILIQLQSKRVVKAQDIAERFDISLRTVYRDIRTLEEAGVPVLGEAGVGYSLMEGYRLPPVMFTIEEATAFLTAEKLIEQLTDSSTEESYKSAMYKIKAVLRSGEKDFLESMDDHIAVIKSTCLPEPAKDLKPLQPILKCIAEKKIISIAYFANHSQQNTERRIEPIGIFYLMGHWHVIAYCLLRNDYRDFRIDRMSRITLTTDSFHKEHPTLKAYLKQMKKEKSLETVVIRVDKEILKHINVQKYYNGFVSEKDLGDSIEMTFLTSSIEGFLRWYMMFVDKASIVSPPALITAFKSLVSNISRQLA